MSLFGWFYRAPNHENQHVGTYFFVGFKKHSRETTVYIVFFEDSPRSVKPALVVWGIELLVLVDGKWEDPPNHQSKPQSKPIGGKLIKHGPTSGEVLFGAFCLDVRTFARCQLGFPLNHKKLNFQRSRKLSSSLVQEEERPRSCSTDLEMERARWETLAHMRLVDGRVDGPNPLAP